MDKNRIESCTEELIHSLYRVLFSGRKRSDFSKSVFQAKWIKYLKYFIISAKHGRWHLHGDYIITLKTNHKVLRIYAEWKYLHLVFSQIRTALLQGRPTASEVQREKCNGGTILLLWFKTQTWIKISVSTSALTLSQIPKTQWFESKIAIEFNEGSTL